jgi:hypothetical protein
MPAAWMRAAGEAAASATTPLHQSQGVGGKLEPLHGIERLQAQGKRPWDRRPAPAGVASKDGRFQLLDGIEQSFRDLARLGQQGRQRRQPGLVGFDRRLGGQHAQGGAAGFGVGGVPSRPASSSARAGPASWAAQKPSSACRRAGRERLASQACISGPPRHRHPGAHDHAPRAARARSASAASS